MEQIDGELGDEGGEDEFENLEEYGEDEYEEGEIRMDDEEELFDRD